MGLRKLNNDFSTRFVSQELLSRIVENQRPTDRPTDCSSCNRIIICSAGFRRGPKHRTASAPKTIARFCSSRHTPFATDTVMSCSDAKMEASPIPLTTYWYCDKKLAVYHYCRSRIFSYRYVIPSAAPSAVQTRCSSFAYSPESLSSFAASSQSVPGENIINEGDI